jgi:hypothetical protein
MTTQTPMPERTVWKDMRAIVSTARARTLRPAHSQQHRLATKTQAEKEADRWVAEMMFDHYNG